MITDAILPAHWTWVTVGDVAIDLRYGTSAKTSTDDSGVPVLRMGNISSVGEIRLDDLKYLPKGHPDLGQTILKTGDLIFNRTNSVELVGKSAVYQGLPDNCSFASYLIRARLGPRCLPMYLAYVLNSHFGKAWIKSVVSQQVGQANVNGSKLRKFRFPLPPIREQYEMVAEIEKQFTRIDAARSCLETAMTRVARFKSAVLGDQLSPRNNWPRVALKQVTERITDGTHQPPVFVDRGVPFLFVRHIVGGVMSFEDTRFISEETYRRLHQRRPILKGDVLYSAVGSYGVAVEVNTSRPFSFQRHIAHLIPRRSEILPRFLVHCLNAPAGVEQAHAAARGVAQKTVTLGDLCRFEIPLPSLSVQKSVVDRIDDLLGAQGRMVAAIRFSLMRSSRLRQAILTQALSGMPSVGAPGCTLGGPDDIDDQVRAVSMSLGGTRGNNVSRK